MKFHLDCKYHWCRPCLHQLYNHINLIDTNVNLVRSSLYDYITDAGKACTNGICNQDEISNIISETGGLSEYKVFIKNASKTFADNKGNSVSLDDFEY